MEVKHFGQHLYTILAYKLIQENPDSSEYNPDDLEKSLGFSKENSNYSDLTDDISRSVLMLSYAYRFAFKDHFRQVFPILIRAEGNALIYVRCFAETSYKRYSPLKFLIVCSFISEIFLYLSKRLVSKRKRSYIKQTTEAFNDTFQRIFEKDFPQNGWTGIQNVASKLAKGFPFLAVYMDSETTYEKASEAAKVILTDNAVGTDAIQGGIISREFKNPRALCYDLNSQVFVNLIEVPFILSDGLTYNLLYNQTTYVIENLGTPVLPVSFGTNDQNAEITFMQQVSGNQNEAATFLNQPLATETSYEVSGAIEEPSNTEPHARENSTARNYRDESQPSLRTMKLTEDGKNELCAADDAVIYEQESMDGEAQFWVDFLSSDSDDESAVRVKKTENLETESRIDDDTIISGLESGDAEKQFLKHYFSLSLKTGFICDIVKGYSIGFKKNDTFLQEVNFVDPGSQTIPKDDNVIDPESETIPNDNDSQESETVPKKNVIDLESKMIPKDENSIDSESETIPKEEDVIGPESETIPNDHDSQESETVPKENVIDFESKTIPKDENAVDSESETIPKEEYVIDPESGTILKENVVDLESVTIPKENIISAESETILKEDNVIQPESETISKDEKNDPDSLASGNGINIPENLSGAFYQTQSTTLQDDAILQAASSQKTDAKQLHEIEINIQIDENDLSAKVLHLNLSGKKFVVRMRPDMTLIFKYNGRTPSTKDPQTKL